MLYELFRAMLGPIGGFLDWAKVNPVPVAIPLFLWATLWYIAKLQLKRIETHTTQLVLDMGREAIAASSNISVQTLYQRIYPVWAAALPNWAWFMPHRLELWPVRVSPERVQQSLDFSPQWIADVLANHDIVITH